MTQAKLHTTPAGHTLAYSTAGQPGAPPVMMVHGLLSYRGVWRQTMEALQASHFCVAVDLLGFGDSDKPAEADYGLPAQGRRVLHLADALGWERFALMGHSMGGQIAVHIAAELAPRRITQLVSVAGVVSARLNRYVEKVVYRWIALGKAFPPAFAAFRAASRYRWTACSRTFGFGTWFYRPDAISFEDWAIDREMAFQPGGQVPAYRSGQAIYALDLTERLARITAPTLAIMGRQDSVVLLSDGRLMEQWVPNSRLVWIDECGHFPMYEQTAQYLAAVQSFFRAGGGIDTDGAEYPPTE